MVKSETRRDAQILVKNPSPRLLGKKFRDSKKLKSNHAKTRLGGFSKTLSRFRDPAKILRDPRFSKYHSPLLLLDDVISRIIKVEVRVISRSRTKSAQTWHECIMSRVLRKFTARLFGQNRKELDSSIYNIKSRLLASAYVEIIIKSSLKRGL